MSIRSFLFKPRWQNKDADVRATAVAEGQEPELIEALPRILLTDESVKVRLASARRVRDLEVLLEARQKASDPNEQAHLDGRIASLAGSTASDRPPLKARQEALEHADRDLLEQLARTAPEAELRHSAISRVERQGLLGDIAIGDPDPGLRRLAAERIQQHSTLQRVIEGVRKSDKDLYQALQGRLHTEKLAAGDPGAVEKEALDICKNLEALLLNGDKDGLAEQERRWNRMASLATAAQSQRHEALVSRIQNPAPPSAAIPSQPAPEPSEPDPAPVPAAQVSAVTQAEPVSPKPPRSSGPEEDHQAVFDEIDACLGELEEALENGELAAGLRLQGKVLDLSRPVRRTRQWKVAEARLRRRQGRLRELRDWQHWSNNKHRQELIDEMASLHGSGLHPDAVLDRIKALQKQWKELERSEQIPGEKHFSAPAALWRQFQTVGQAVFEQTKPFLDKRSEVQEKHLEDMQNVIRQLEEQSAEDSPDWIALRRTLGQGGQAMRELDGIPARQRRKVAGQLRAAMGKARSRISDHNSVIEKAKRKLVREAANLTHIEDKDEAIAQAKSLQADWKRAGSLPRGLEQKLWKQFREPIDPLFEELDSQREAQQAERKEALSAQQDLLEQMENLLKAPDDELSALSGKIKGLDDAWGEYRHPDKKLRQQFRQLTATYEKRIQDFKRTQANLEHERWWHKAELLQDLESRLAAGKVDSQSAAKWAKKWTTAEAPGELEDQLDQRWAAALSALQAGTTPAWASDQALQEVRMLCIALEFLSGMASPEEDSELRMEYQVTRLSESMAGQGDRKTSREQAREAEQQWLLMPPMKPADRKRYGLRVKAALDEIKKA